MSLILRIVKLRLVEVSNLLNWRRLERLLLNVPRLLLAVAIVVIVPIVRGFRWNQWRWRTRQTTGLTAHAPSLGVRILSTATVVTADERGVVIIVIPWDKVLAVVALHRANMATA